MPALKVITEKMALCILSNLFLDCTALTGWGGGGGVGEEMGADRIRIE